MTETEDPKKAEKEARRLEREKERAEATRRLKERVARREHRELDDVGKAIDLLKRAEQVAGISELRDAIANAELAYEQILESIIE